MYITEEDLIYYKNDSYLKSIPEIVKTDNIDALLMKLEKQQNKIMWWMIGIFGTVIVNILVNLLNKGVS